MQRCLINISFGDDTSLHEVDTALTKVKEEVDSNANLIWGIQKDEKFNGKFRISVIATGIESESYYQNLIDSNSSNEIKENELSLNKTNVNEIENSEINEKNNETSGFVINLQETKTSIDQELNKQEKIIENEVAKNKSSIFSRFLEKNHIKDKIEENKVNFFEEIREISDEDDKNIQSQNEYLTDKKISETNSEGILNDETVSDEKTQSSNEINDDLLQIPAFLRRQAN